MRSYLMDLYELLNLEFERKLKIITAAVAFAAAYNKLPGSIFIFVGTVLSLSVLSRRSD